MKHPHRNTIVFLLFVQTAVATLFSGCAYYNTFYNAKRKFSEAERETIQVERQSILTQRTQNAQSSTQPRPIPMDKYRKVIETCSKLLEYYPKSRWVDDALYLMGISYYRINDMARAERKFTELTSLFPKSPHLSSAMIWRARTLAEQKSPEKAIELLEAGISRLKPGYQRAEALYNLASLYSQLEQWSNAARYYEECLREKQSRENRAIALFEYGLAKYHISGFSEARNAFSEAAQTSTNLNHVYNSYIHWSRSEVALNNFDAAQGILLRLRSSERFLDFIEDTELELANLSVQNGQYDEAISLYENFIDNHANGEKRGLAFYRLAEIYHEHHPNLLLSKALLDSAIRVGAVKSIADSARITLEQISKGLLALEEIGGLLEQIKALERNSSTAAQPLNPIIPPSESENRPEAPTSQHEINTAAQETTDTLANERSDQDNKEKAESSRMSPAALAADSILNTLQTELLRRANIDSDAVDMTTSQPIVPESSGEAAGQLTHLRRKLQTAYLHIAEFYKFTLGDDDSSRYYYFLAAADTVNPAIYWRANLFLAQAALGKGDSLTPDAERYFHTVLNADSVPLNVQNSVRRKLGMPLLEIPQLPQKAALRAAEIAQAQESVAVDSLLNLYSVVIRMDSTSDEAQTAFFAKAHIFETILKQQDSVRNIYKELIRLHPSSSYVQILTKRLKEPDSLSVFLMSDEQLFGGAKEKVEAILQPVTDKSGWPPPEESLRGRRFR